MKKLFIGNIVSLIASFFMIYAGTKKDKKEILLFQTLQILLYMLSDLILGGVSGAIINLLSALRNILCYKEKLGKKEEIILTILGVFFSIRFNIQGIMGLLPLLSMLIYIWFLKNSDVIKLKYIIIITTLIWAIYDGYTKLYVSVGFDILCIIVNYISLKKIKNKTR